jgi:hypothetical protein
VPQAGSTIVSPGSVAMQATIAWISGRGVKYWPAPDFVGRALAQELLVGVALDVGADAPVLLVDEVDDQPLELGRVLDPVLGLAEDRADDAVACRARPRVVRV